MRRRLLVVLAVIAAAALLAQARVAAHHAFASEFDENQPIMLDGVLKKMEWVNPHAWLHVDVKDPKTGEVVTWMVEGGAPNNLLRRGFGKNTTPVGTEIHIEGYRAKQRGVNRANGVILEIAATGEAFFLGSSGTGAPYERGKDNIEYDENGRPRPRSRQQQQK